MQVIAKAPPNIAFVKYWGKRSISLNLPVADSVSVCLDDFHSTASVRPNTGASDDRIFWNDVPLSPPYLGRCVRMLERMRERSGKRLPVVGRIKTGLPSRVGLATSASGMAALAAALHRFHGLEEDRRELSGLARLGSGSAARSIPDGFVIWHMGTREDGTDSVAESFAPPEHWQELRAVLPIIELEKKLVSSAEGMIRTAQTCPYFDSWVRYCRGMVPRATDAILTKDFHALGDVAESHAASLHSVCLQARPPILYLSRKTILAVEAVAALKPDVQVFHTFDAGPNPMFFTFKHHVPAVSKAVADVLPGVDILVAGPGPGAAIVQVEPD